MALRVLAHFVPGEKVLDFVAPEADWLTSDGAPTMTTLASTGSCPTRK